MNGRADVGNALARVAGAAAALIALAVAGVLALFFAATVVVMAVIASALIGVSLLVMRARRPARAHAAPGLIEARRVGHTWVAYGWNEPRR
jgi:cobalamin biosynthesis protein CobD/CbiB